MRKNIQNNISVSSLTSCTGDGLDEFGLGDTVQSFFFSPKASSPIWGVCPVFLIPAANMIGTRGLW